MPDFSQVTDANLRALLAKAEESRPPVDADPAEHLPGWLARGRYLVLRIAAGGPPPLGMIDRQAAVLPYTHAQREYRRRFGGCSDCDDDATITTRHRPHKVCPHTNQRCPREEFPTMHQRKIEKLEHIAAAARQVRTLQRRYFKGDRDLIDDCRKAEQALDALLAELENDQLSLFGPADGGPAQ